MKKKLPLLLKSILVSLNMFSLSAMETTTDDVIFPDPQLYPTVAQVEEAYEGRYHYNYRYPSIKVGELIFHQGELEVCFNKPIKFKNVKIDKFDGGLSIFFEGKSGGIEYKCVSGKKGEYSPWPWASHNFFGASKEENKQYIENRALLVNNKMLRVGDILTLADQQEIYFGWKFVKNKDYFEKEFQGIDNKAFMNLKLAPLNASVFNDIKRLGNALILNKVPPATAFYPDPYQTDENSPLYLVYKINLYGIEEIKITATLETSG